MILGDGTEVRMGNTYGQGEVGDERGSKEMDRCPLTVRFIWGLPQEDSFMKLKELVTSAPVLVLPNDNLPFRLEADGSSIATGAVLSQQQVDDNAWHPVTFLSNALNPVEQNYEIYDTEMLAIIRGLEEWRHYLEGAVMFHKCLTPKSVTIRSYMQQK
jgi:hypothetical protein